jgi:APA family basic amino acid/polyamine antiporter
MLPAMFSYGGWQQGLWMGGEVKDPERTLPRALVTGVVIVVCVYLAAVWAYFELLGFEGVTGAGALAAEAVGRVYPGAGARVVAGAVALSAFGVLNAQFLTGPRLTYAVSADGRFFSVFASVHPRTGTPLAAVLLLCGLTIAVLTIGTDRMGGLTAWIVVLDALFFGLTGLALLRLGARGLRWWVCAGGFAALELACVAFSLFDDDVQASALAGAVWVAVALAASRFWTPRRPAR